MRAYYEPTLRAVALVSVIAVGLYRNATPQLLSFSSS
jgi:hypothetical protein